VEYENSAKKEKMEGEAPGLKISRAESKKKASKRVCLTGEEAKGSTGRSKLFGFGEDNP